MTIAATLARRRPDDDHGRTTRDCRGADGLGRRRFATLWRLSLPAIQRMQASEGMVLGDAEALVIKGLDDAGAGLIAGGAASPSGGRGVRLLGVGNEARSDRSEGLELDGTGRGVA